MPTLRDLRDAYPGRSDLELLNRWNQTHQGQPLTNDATFGGGEANPVNTPAPEPNLLQRVRNLANEHPTLSKMGIMGAAGLAAAPLTGGMSIPATMAIEGIAGGLGSIADAAVKGAPLSGGELATDAALSAATPIAGKALSGVGRVAADIGRRVGRTFMPSSVGALTRLGLEPAGRLVEGAGNLYTKGFQKLQSMGEGLFPGAESSAEQRAAASVREASARQAAKARMAGAKVTDMNPMAGEPVGPGYRPSGFRQTMNEYGPAAESMQTVEATSVPQMKPSMSEVEQLTQGMVRQEPRPGNIPFVNAAKLTPADWAELNAFMGKGITEEEKAALRSQIAQPGQMPASVRGLLEPEQAAMAQPQMHAAESSADFGFPDLPELSDAELSRMQSGWARTGYDRYVSPNLPRTPQESVDAIRRFMGR